MAVSIRLRREGRKNRPYYRIVVTQKTSPRDGKFIEQVGSYDPLVAKSNFSLDLPRIEHWVSKGAQPSETVQGFIRKTRKEAKAAK